VTKKLSRRQLLRAASGAGLALAAGCGRGSGGSVPTADPESSATPILEHVAGYGDPRRWEGRALIVATPGDENSEYLNAQIGAIFEPFQRLTGATIRTARTDLDELRLQVDQAEVFWSVCDVPAEEVLPLANSGVIDEIDYSAVDANGLFVPFVLSHGVGVSLFATALAYQESAFVDTGVPRGWEDFWDLTKFPGFRGFQESPIGTLEFALLANGVALDELYPLDVDLAFRRLDEIVEQIALWWRQGAQPTQMIAAGDLAMVAAWHDRILTLVEGGATVNLVWDRSQINGDCWVVPNGAPEREVAMDLVNFATRPEVCAAFARLFPFGPMHSGAYALLDESFEASRPGGPGIVDQQFAIDLEWWFPNREPLVDRFEDWLAEEPEPDI
jgi:putative spermidine/putrescine transport system substrate-binding protein